jgi:uncharacterized protein
MKRILTIIALVYIPIAVLALPRPQGFVSDYMGLLDSQSRTQITEAIEAIEKSTSAEIAVVIQNSLPADSSIEELALAYLEEWKVGKPEKNNGLVLLIIDDEANKYHGYRFEAGRGLEGDLPDGLLGQIGREEMVQYFRSGDYGNGILAAVVRIGGILGADLSAKAPKKKNNKVPGIGVLIFIVIIFLFMLGGRGRGGGVGSNLLMALLIGQALGGRRGGFGGGGFGSGGFGGSSGGFGGFGGGGGGSGGGATGSW